MSKTIVRQILITIYSDGSRKRTEMKLNRTVDSKGRYISKKKPASAKTEAAQPPATDSKLPTIDPANIPGLDEHGNVTRRVTCPDCGLVFVRTFKIVKD